MAESNPKPRASSVDIAVEGPDGKLASPWSIDELRAFATEADDPPSAGAGAAKLESPSLPSSLAGGSMRPDLKSPEEFMRDASLTDPGAAGGARRGTRTRLAKLELMLRYINDGTGKQQSQPNEQTLDWLQAQHLQLTSLESELVARGSAEGSPESSSLAMVRTLLQQVEETKEKLEAQPTGTSTNQLAVPGAATAQSGRRPRISDSMRATMNMFEGGDKASPAMLSPERRDTLP